MKRPIGICFVISLALLGGCATKKYVAQTVDPVNAKVNQVDQNNQKTQKQLDETEPRISAADEKATSADVRATDAMGRADAASKKSDQVRDQLRSELNDRIADLDDYKAANSATVLFKVNSSQLSDEAKQQLDQMTAGSISSAKRYFIAIQGFTDKTGSADYNLELSRRRAQAVQSYLVAQHNIPVFRIQIVGLGKDKPVNEEKKRDAMAKNRRVEVTLFSADAALAGMEKPAAQTQNPQPQQ